MSSLLATLKEVNQRGSERQSGNPKSSSLSLAGPGGAQTPQRSGLVGFYMPSCGRLTGGTQKLVPTMERDYHLTWSVVHASLCLPHPSLRALLQRDLRPALGEKEEKEQEKRKSSQAWAHPKAGLMGKGGEFNSLILSRPTQILVA